MRRHPLIVVVETPARIDGHARDLIGLDRDQAEQRGREIGTLIRRADAGGLQRARVAAATAVETPNQFRESADHGLIPAAAPWPTASARKTAGTRPAI